MSGSFYRIVNNTVVKTVVQSSTYWHGQILCVSACVRAWFHGSFHGSFWHLSIHIQIFSHKSELKRSRDVTTHVRVSTQVGKNV